jgi:tetratricopeptide (TPR) repeat protein
LLEPGEAKAHLEEALSQAQGLRSQYWINHVGGALVAAYYMSNDLARGDAYLDSLVSPQTAMDTMGKRYCWARRAELALRQGKPALTLEFVDRLITSAPGLSPGGTVTFLWQLKGEALAAMGRAGEAEPLLQTAARNAQALDERFLLWRVYASLGRLYREMNRPEEAQEHFSTACELIEELAMTISDGTLKDNYRQRAFDTVGVS